MTARTGDATGRNETAATLGRCAVLLAVLLQAGGQVAYGTYLRALPSPLFVFASFLTAMLFFLAVSGRTDPYTVMVTMAAMPIVTFALQGLSPAYAWTWPTALGLAVVAAFIIGDIVTNRKPVHRVP